MRNGEEEVEDSGKEACLPLNGVPFVLLPEVAGEGNQQRCGKGPQPRAQLHPELHALAWQRFLLGQRRASYTQLRLGPHIQQVLGSDTHVPIVTGTQDGLCHNRIIAWKMRATLRLGSRVGTALALRCISSKPKRVSKEPKVLIGF